jgi:protein-S-isoprenylcysteine O-methyltransferase Ste14
LIPFILNRIRMEELVEAEYGERYPKYKNATSRLIPLMY